MGEKYRTRTEIIRQAYSKNNTEKKSIISLCSTAVGS
jgi:hypothetical protein